MHTFEAGNFRRAFLAPGRNPTFSFLLQQSRSPGLLSTAPLAPRMCVLKASEEHLSTATRNAVVRGCDVSLAPDVSPSRSPSLCDVYFVITQS